MTLLLLTLAYVAVLALLLNLGLKSNWKWQVKLGAVLVSFLFYVGTWYGLKHLQGWAVDEQLPDSFRLISQHVVQPNKLKGTSGAIYVWVVDLDESTGKEPRAYRLPYIEQLHNDILEAVSDGRPKLGRRVQQVPGYQNRHQSGNGFIEFYEEPRARLPEKD
jgi:hypothetical protein